MKISILIPHYKNGKITAHCIHKLLEHKGSHDIEILVVDNNAKDGSIKYLKPFVNDIKYQRYPHDMIQSHGVAMDFILPYVQTDYFIMMESDSYPTENNFLDYYEDLINRGYDSATSYLKLSGGSYGHPCGGLFSKKVWQEAKQYCNAVEYAYFPNMAYKYGFASHVMLHKSIVEDVLKKPFDYVELSDEYKNFTRQQWMEKLMWYSPTVAPFHMGMGSNNESVKTYGNRNKETESSKILLDNKKKIIFRVGLEPAQWFYYWMLAKGYKIFEIPTEIKWMPNRENEQQEYTSTESGITHIWAGSSYLDMENTPMNDVYEFKKTQIEELYNSLSEKLKIKE